MPDENTPTTRENIWIPLSDGRRLAARLWLPDGSDVTPVPAIIEYMPYRKRDTTRARDEPIHAWFAARGYACLRVDINGSGDSDGVLTRMWDQREQDDAVEMIAWVAAQAWCGGDVIMFGKSWGAYAAYQVAMHRPPALKGIIAVCGGDDRYDQALHFTGGALLNETVWWTEAMLQFNMRPPDPEMSGPDWRAKWHARLEANEPMLGEWLRHQRRDEFWKTGSVCEDYASIDCPVFVVGGWSDYLSRSVLRLVGRLSAPRRGLVGPWGHHYPHDGVPGPAIGFLRECERFIVAALTKGDVDDEPLLRVWMPEYRVPAPEHADQSGRWISERAWPSPRIEPYVMALNADGLRTRPAPEHRLIHRSPQTIGLCSPEWLSQGLSGEIPMDQREDDDRSLTFDSLPLTERIEILGSAVLDLDIEIDQQMAFIAARLNDVAPDGTSLRIALGVLNLTHRDSDAEPTPMVPGQRTRIRLTLPETAHAFAPGHRVRVALSTSFWPIIWPSPRPVVLAVYAGSSSLALPRRPPDPDDAALRPFDPPERGPALPVTVLEPSRVAGRRIDDPLTGETTLVTEIDGLLGTARRFRIEPTGTVLDHTFRKCCIIREGDPLSARIEIAQAACFERGGWRVRLETRTRLRADVTHFHIDAEARAFDGGVMAFERTWQVSEPRDLV